MATLSTVQTRSPPPHKMTRIPPKILASTSTTRLRYPLKQGQSRLFHRLPSGLQMEVIISQKPLKQLDSGPNPDPNPPLVFVHGSFHAAWCWAEHWMPFFSGYGYDCYAVSLLGHGESDSPSGSAAGTLQMHASDIADFIRKEVNLPPVLIGHSFGGLIVQSYLSNRYSSHRSSSSVSDNLHPQLAGAVLVCSVPPSGNSGLVWRYLLTKPVAAIKQLHLLISASYSILLEESKVTLSLAAKAFANSLSLCKETFFSSKMDDRLVQRYQELMRESSKLPLFDLKRLNASLPVASIPKNSVEVLVIGASNDFIVDKEGLHETAKFFDVQEVSIQGVAHDIMLDSSWEKGAETILSWLKSSSKQPLTP